MYHKNWYYYNDKIHLDELHIVRYLSIVVKVCHNGSYPMMYLFPGHLYINILFCYIKSHFTKIFAPATVCPLTF